MASPNALRDQGHEKRVLRVAVEEEVAPDELALKGLLSNLLQHLQRHCPDEALEVVAVLRTVLVAAVFLHLYGTRDSKMHTFPGCRGACNA